MSPRFHRWAGLPILFLVAWAPLPAEGAEAPIPLYTPRPKTPIEAAGSDLVPEVRVRVEVDPRGRVTAVEVLGIVPSSKFDEHFERETVDTLMRWRYYPAESDGQPEPTRLEWTLKFPPLRAYEEEPGQQDSNPSWHLLDRGEDSGDRYRRYVLSLPVDERLDMLKDFVATAEGHLNRDSIKEHATGRVIALTDAPSGEVARVLADNVESTFNILQEILKSKVEPQPEPHKIVAVIYASEQSFKGLVREVRANEKWAGFYNPAGLLAFHMNMPSNESLTGLLLHEATHAYVDRYVARPGVIVPRWLGEGFAEYIGNSTIKKKQLVPGKTRRTEVYRSQWASQAGRSQNLVTAREVQDAVRRGEAMSLEEVVTAGPHEFYGERSRMFYAMSWLLVHFLRHGEEGWAENEFPSLMLYVAEGYPALETLRQFYGEPDDLEPSFHEYVKSF
jgi:TonB family protein